MAFRGLGLDWFSWWLTSSGPASSDGKDRHPDKCETPLAPGPVNGLVAGDHSIQTELIHQLL